MRVRQARDEACRNSNEEERGEAAPTKFRGASEARSVPERSEGIRANGEGCDRGLNSVETEGLGARTRDVPERSERYEQGETRDEVSTKFTGEVLSEALGRRGLKGWFAAGCMGFRDLGCFMRMIGNYAYCLGV